MRLYPAAPLFFLHESMEECTVSGYNFPSGTQLFINVWKLQRDPHVWEEPCKFQPERFLTRHKDTDVRGQNFELLPFSSGRRMCPGVSFALQVMQFTLASLPHGFDIATPSNEPLDMGERLGLTVEKSTPLEWRLLTSDLATQVTESDLGHSSKKQKKKKSSDKNKTTDTVLLVEMKRWFTDTTRNEVLRMTGGKDVNSVDGKNGKSKPSL
ncbi:hypothetical protein KPL71_015043 [Citrus sinensis]|uniref:Uncharacterized protein n=1 Tax=Citrus sinensis TaxID=2711 RepID=A0ACB8KG82_CITSI|nr:hypothetical protein KPL71_015043 [Citrus sinensis]